MLGADLRNRLVPIAAVGDWVDVGLAGNFARHLHGRIVHRQPRPAAPARKVCRAAPVAGLRVARSRHRGVRVAGAGGHSARERRLFRGRVQRTRRNVAARCGRRSMHAGADGADGRVPSRHRALGGIDAARCRVVGIALRRQHRRSGIRLPLRRILFAAHLRHGRSHLRGGGDQLDRRGAQLLAGDADAGAGFARECRTCRLLRR